MSCLFSTTPGLLAASWERVWANVLVGGYGLLGVGLGAAVLLALFFVTGARWSALIQPVAERLTLLLPVGALAVVLVLIAAPTLYPWTLETYETPSEFQALWLTRPFFLARTVIYLTLWLGMVFLLVRASQRQRTEPESHHGGPVRLSAAFLVVFALTCWMASADWIMSMEPKWSSTIFGVYHFAGMFLGALAAVVVFAVWFDYRGALGGRLSREQWRDLGTLLFAFSSFWMYIWFCQYLLIWYVYNPEEAEYLIVRQRDTWLPLLLANLVLNWGVPFVVLLFRPAKESPFVLLAVALVVLLGRWLDLYLMILPPVAGSGGSFVAWEASLLVGAAIVAAVIVARPSPHAMRGGIR
jgi:hypothetical protein